MATSRTYHLLLSSPCCSAKSHTQKLNSLQEMFEKFLGKNSVGRLGGGGVEAGVAGVGGGGEQEGGSGAGCV